jgi:hypothetical protein
MTSSFFYEVASLLCGTISDVCNSAKGAPSYYFIREFASGSACSAAQLTIGSQMQMIHDFTKQLK